MALSEASRADAPPGEVPTVGLFIDGEWVEATNRRTFESRNPADTDDLIVEALRYLESTLGREEADQIERIQAILARLGRSPGVGSSGPTF